MMPLRLGGQAFYFCYSYMNQHNIQDLVSPQERLIEAGEVDCGTKQWPQILENARDLDSTRAEYGYADY